MVYHVFGELHFSEWRRDSLTYVHTIVGTPFLLWQSDTFVHRSNGFVQRAVLSIRSTRFQV